MGNNYAFKDILFGLRKEYLAIQKELNELDGYVNKLLYDDKIENVNFRLVHDYSQKKAIMLCYIYERKNILRRRLENLGSNLFGTYPRVITDCVKYNNGIYSLENNMSIIDYFKREEFSQKVNDILETDFAKNIGNMVLGFGFSSEDSILGIFPSEINLINDSGAIMYGPNKGDFVRIHSCRWRLSKNLIEDLLNKEFSRKQFSQYHQGLIEDRILLNKPISIEGKVGNCTNAQFNILEEPDRLVLRRRMGIGHIKK